MQGIVDAFVVADGRSGAGQEASLDHVVKRKVLVVLEADVSDENLGSAVGFETTRHLASHRVAGPVRNRTFAPSARVRVEEERGRVRVELGDSLHQIRLEIPNGVHVRTVVVLDLEGALVVSVVVRVGHVAMSFELAE